LRKFVTSETADLGGLDVFHGISQYLFKELSSMTTSPAFFDEIVGEGKLGIKTGLGFYDYQGISRDEVLRKRDLYFIRQLKLIRDVKAS
jgi:3-hydroxybutyryl-CoA dehydrogenase